jgi:hypothetical protein
MTALVRYTSVAEEANRISKKISGLNRVLSVTMRNLEQLLNEVIIENNLLSDIRWKYKTIESGYIWFESDSDVSDLLDFMQIKDTLSYHHYYLLRSEDNDYVILSMTIGQQGIRLEIAEDEVSDIIKTYNLKNIDLDTLSSLVARLSSHIDLLTGMATVVSDLN